MPSGALCATVGTVPAPLRIGALGCIVAGVPLLALLLLLTPPAPPLLEIPWSFFWIDFCQVAMVDKYDEISSAFCRIWACTFIVGSISLTRQLVAVKVAKLQHLCFSQDSQG